jgi:hypothetical protein
MSIAKNHHYVSQCHLRNFFNNEDGKIYLYDKQLNNPFWKPTTKSVFSELESNTRVTNGEIDHSSLEDDLKIYEDNFPENFQIVTQFAQNPNNPPANYRDSFLELAKYGITSEARHPIIKQFMDDQIDEQIFGRILPVAAPEFKAELEQQQAIRAMTKYSNAVDYSELAEQVLELMGELCYIVYVIKTDDYFILPDRYALVIREKINEYFNPDIKEIALIAMPLSSKVFISIISKKFMNGFDTVVEFTENNRAAIFDLNKDMFDWSLKQVACENQVYLSDFIKQAHQNNG